MSWKNLSQYFAVKDALSIPDLVGNSDIAWWMIKPLRSGEMQPPA
jgi:hypothetical protein